MICLFIDTSTIDVSIALVRDGEVLASICKEVPNMHSVYTVSYLDRCFKEARIGYNDVDKVMVVNGPGSFTGVRIGVTIAKTFAYLLKKEIVPVSSLKIRALGLPEGYDKVMVLLDAKHDNFYMAVYDRNGNEIIKEQFNNIDYVKKLEREDNLVIVKDKDIIINGNKVGDWVIKPDVICAYYGNTKGSNVHMVNPNYLKLPQPLEGKQ